MYYEQLYTQITLRPRFCKITIIVLFEPFYGNILIYKSLKQIYKALFNRQFWCFMVFFAAFRGASYRKTKYNYFNLYILFGFLCAVCIRWFSLSVLHQLAVVLVQWGAKRDINASVFFPFFLIIQPWSIQFGHDYSLKNTFFHVFYAKPCNSCKKNYYPKALAFEQ